MQSIAMYLFISENARIKFLFKILKRRLSSNWGDLVLYQQKKKKSLKETKE